MANETPFSFNIESTSFTGNQELLEDILSPESTTAEPDEVEKADQEEPEKKDTKTQKKEEIISSEISSDDFDSLLGDDDDDETDEKEPPAKKELINKKSKEKEEKTEEDKTEEDEDDDDSTDDEQESTYESLSKDLIKLGIFTESEDGEQTVPTTSQEFLERWEAEKKKGATQTIDDFLGRFGDSYKEAFDAIFVKGVSPKDYLGSIAEIQDYSELDITKEVNQEKIVRDALRTQGFEQEDIDAEVEKLKNYGDLEETSKRYQKVLLKNKEKQLQKLVQDKEQEAERNRQYETQYANSLQTILNEKLKQKEFDGIPLTPKKAQQVYSFLNDKNWKLPSGELLTDFDTFFLNLKKPENFPLKVKIGLLALNNFDLSTIEKKAVSKESGELFETLATKKVKSKTNNKANNKKEPEIKSWWSS